MKYQSIQHKVIDASDLNDNDVKFLLMVSTIQRQLLKMVRMHKNDMIRWKDEEGRCTDEEIEQVLAKLEVIYRLNLVAIEEMIKEHKDD